MMRMRPQLLTETATVDSQTLFVMEACANIKTTTLHSVFMLGRVEARELLKTKFYRRDLSYAKIHPLDF